MFAAFLASSDRFMLLALFILLPLSRQNFTTALAMLLSRLANPLSIASMVLAGPAAALGA